MPPLKKNNPKYIDYLDEDPEVPGQKFVVLSFVSPYGNQKCDTMGLKVRGVYGIIEEARKRAEEVRKFDPDFDVHIAMVGYWLPWNPDPNKVGSEEFQEEALNEIVKGHKQNILLSKQHFMDRKRDMVEKAMLEGMQEGQEELANKKEHPISVKNRIKTLEDEITNLNERIKLAEENKSKTEQLWKTYSIDEIEAAEKEFEELREKMEKEKNTGDAEKDKNDLKSLKVFNEQEQSQEPKIEISLLENVQKVKTI